MAAALHLQYLEELWAQGGPLQQSLAEALADPPLRPKPLRPPRARHVQARLERLIDKRFEYLDRKEGDADLEPEPLEMDADFEMSQD